MCKNCLNTDVVVSGKSPVFGKDFDSLFVVPETLKKVAVLPREIVKNQLFTASLDTNIKFVSGDAQKFRVEFEKMRRYSGSVLVDEKDKERGYSTVCICGVRRLNADLEKSPVNVVLGAQSKKIFFNGLMKCGSVWRCPVCSFKITKHRQDEIYYMSSEWLRQGGQISFVTLTLRHKVTDTLKNSTERLLSEFRKMQSSKLFKGLEKQHEIFGFVKTLEITFGFENGWHPHLHLLVFHKSTDFDILHKEFIKIWCKRKKVNALQKSQRAKIVYNGEGISEYVTKWDMTKEMTQSSFKEAQGERFTPFSILRELSLENFEGVQGEYFKELLHLKYVEYCVATKGKHFISVSKRLKAYFKELSGNDMKTDTEILEDEKVDKILFKIDVNLWDYFVKDKSVLPSYLLNAYENGGIEYVMEFFNNVGYNVGFEPNKKLFYPIMEDMKNIIKPFTLVYVRKCPDSEWKIRRFKGLAPKGVFVYRNQNEKDINGFREFYSEYTFYNPFEN